MEIREFVNSETEAPKIQILLTLNLVQSLLQMAEEKENINSQKSSKNAKK